MRLQRSWTAEERSWSTVQAKNNQGRGGPEGGEPSWYGESLAPRCRLNAKMCSGLVINICVQSTNRNVLGNEDWILGSGVWTVVSRFYHNFFIFYCLSTFSDCATLRLVLKYYFLYLKSIMNMITIRNYFNRTVFFFYKRYPIGWCNVR